jgi:integrase/recombinase XerD
MLDRITGNDAISVRGRAILEVAYSSALRPREIRDLKLGHVNHRDRTLLLEHSKGDKSRTVPVGKDALDWVRRYVLEIRPHYVRRHDQDSVFVSHCTGEPLTVRGLWWAIREALRRNGLPPIAPYSIRGSAAAALLAGGAGVGYIGRILGHECLITTAGYLRIEDQEMGERIADGHPRAAWGHIEADVETGGGKR